MGRVISKIRAILLNFELDIAFDDTNCELVTFGLAVDSELLA